MAGINEILASGDAQISGRHFDELVGTDEHLPTKTATEIAIRLGNLRVNRVEQGLDLLPILRRIIRETHAATASVALAAANNIIRQTMRLAAQTDTEVDFSRHIKTVLADAEGREDLEGSAALTSTSAFIDLKTHLS